MEMISKAAAKMTNSAAACELTSAEIWTLAKTAIELFGAFCVKVRRQVHKLQHRLDQEKLEEMQQEHQTELLIGSAPCI